MASSFGRAVTTSSTNVGRDDRQSPQRTSILTTRQTSFLVTSLDEDGLEFASMHAYFTESLSRRLELPMKSPRRKLKNSWKGATPSLRRKARGQSDFGAIKMRNPFSKKHQKVRNANRSLQHLAFHSIGKFLDVKRRTLTDDTGSS